MYRFIKSLASLSPLLICLLFLFGTATPALAATVNYNNLIADSVFDNYGSMTASQIDAFLNSFPNSCISTNSGFSAPEPTGVNQNTYSFGANVSAGQIIYDAAQAYYINPEVLLATLQKEQGLVTGSSNGSFSCHPNTPSPSWPYTNPPPSSPPPYSYTTFSCTDSQGNSTTCTEACPDNGGCMNIAVGYGCPYNCYTSSEGFSKQIILGAWILEFARQRAEGNVNWDVNHGNWYETNDPNYNYTGPMANSNGQPVQRCASCTAAVYDGSDTLSDGNSVTIANGATASLYNYTPYESGNANFVNIFDSWFGSTQTTIPWAWRYVYQQEYSDSAMTQPYTEVTTVQPGSKFYVTVQAYNAGNQTWQQSNLHIGTSNPNDRSSVFYDSSWLDPQRPAGMQQSSVAPGSTATFNFTMDAPSTPGSYKEYFNLVDDGVTWLNDPGLYFYINVVNPVAATNSQDTSLTAGQTLTTGQYLMSPDTQSILILQSDGNLVLYSDFKPVWSSGTTGTGANMLAMQTDGNLVLYAPGMKPIWNSQTQSNPGAYLTLQTDNNLVVYSPSSSPLWASYTVHNPNHLDYVNTFVTGAAIYPGQELQTANRQYTAILQTDGNFVVYNGSQALWASGTDYPSIHQKVAFANMQSDGNLVVYSTSLKPLWNSGTPENGPSSLNMQPDGNLVIYNANMQPTWASNTAQH